ncbi:MAG TPA: hypothetical protein VMS75_03040 [Terriglobales bacterium]|nr:hypothetical protein [Terriglobales bacterium]
MDRKRCRLPGKIFALLVVLAGLAASAAAEEFVLENGRLRAEFNDRGLAALGDVRTGRRVAFSADPTAVSIDAQRIAVDGLGPAEVETKPAKLTFRYVRDPYTFDVAYELRPGWAFLSKQLVVTSAGRSPFRLKDVALLEAKLDQAVLDELKIADGRWGSFCRFAAPGGLPGVPAWGLFFAVQNPFLSWKRDGQDVSASYAPDMDWSPDYGPFASDRLCIGLYDLSGTRFPARAVPEWKLVADYGKLLAEAPAVDASEVAALTDCVRAFLLYYPGRTRVHIPWCENDYQVDVGTPEGVEEYKRIMDRAAELGANYLLYTPANRELSRLEDNADSWGWENVLWFGLGQKIRRGEWDPETDEVPAGLRSMLDYAASKNLKLMAYAYPSLPFLQKPEWTKWAAGKSGPAVVADTGLRSFQDWWIGKLLAFVRRTGAAGFSFDHWWIVLDGPTSKYAQWYGCRRILETLRREVPDIVIDGRQQYQNFGPWTWLAGSYPHPTLTDEQPESFTAFPDLHADRVSADRQRFAAWTYRVERFAPPEVTPGFITHQSERSDEKDVMRRDRFRPRDWDALGWKYSVLSSIGTAPFNHVIDFIPARDPDEFRALSDDDKAWFRRWLDWTETNAAFLHALKPILGPPMVGRADGTAAVVDDRGFVFLFNPNPGGVEARFRLDASIGLAKGERFVVRELHPEEGKVLGSAEGFFKAGSEVVVPLSGADARVFEVFPAPDKIEEPVLFNVPGTIAFRSGRLALTGVSGEPGTTVEALVLLPEAKTVRALTVNGVPYPFKQAKDLVPVTVRFAGKAFGRLQRLGSYGPAFAGGAVKAKVTIPSRVFKQLADRKAKWPVPYAEDDLRATWLGSWRLLLFVAVAEPDESMDVAVKVNGTPVEVRKAYNSVYPHETKRTYLGSYADLSGLKPDAPYEVEVTLPALEPGRFLGLFFENVEPESTERIVAPQPIR